MLFIVVVVEVFHVFFVLRGAIRAIKHSVSLLYSRTINPRIPLFRGDATVKNALEGCLFSHGWTRIHADGECSAWTRSGSRRIMRPILPARAGDDYGRLLPGWRGGAGCNLSRRGSAIQ